MHKLVLLPIAVLLTGALPMRAGSACDVVIAASLKVLQVPAHLYMTETAGFNGGKTRNFETIYLNGATFIRVAGQWQKSRISPKDLADSKKESEAKLGTCSVVRDEMVGNEPATLYKVHHQGEDAVDAQIWVSKLRGLPLKQINDVDAAAGPRGKTHTEVRYEYSNVTPPTVTETKRR